MLERGIVVSYETIRRWCGKFGQTYAGALRRRQPQPGDKWHLEEVFIKINGRLQYLWRAVDQDGNVLDIPVQPKRNTQAAKRFFRRLLKEYQYVARVIVTDKLRSHGAAHREVIPSVEHRSSKHLRTDGGVDSSLKITPGKIRLPQFGESSLAGQGHCASPSQCSPPLARRRRSNWS
jgi:putative transposase